MKRGLWLALAAAVAVGCGGDDNGREPAEPLPSDGELARFESPRVGFTFDYPKQLVAEKRPRERVLARVAVARNAPLNAIKVRRTASRELEPDRYLDEFERDFERTVDTVDKREEQIGDLATGVLEFEDSAEIGGQTVEFKSASYFFTGGGQTWQLECIADEEHRRQIEDACRIALGSIDFAG